MSVFYYSGGFRDHKPINSHKPRAEIKLNVQFGPVRVNVPADQSRWCYLSLLWPVRSARYINDGSTPRVPAEHCRLRPEDGALCTHGSRGAAGRHHWLEPNDHYFVIICNHGAWITSRSHQRGFTTGQQRHVIPERSPIFGRIPGKVQ